MWYLPTKVLSLARKRSARSDPPLPLVDRDESCPLPAEGEAKNPSLQRDSFTSLRMPRSLLVRR